MTERPDLDRVMRLIEKLEKRINQKPSLWLATVTQVSPLRVRFDSSTTDFPGTPRTVVASHSLGDRVVVAVQDRRITIIGRLGG